jgi:amino acid transporter
MARDGLFFGGAAEVHPVYRTPANAIVAQAVWSTLLVLSGGAEALTTYTGFTLVLFTGAALTALFVLRRREASAPRPFSALGYPVAPAIFAVMSLLMVLNALWTDLATPLTTGRPLGPSSAGLVVIALGLPVFWWFRKTTGVGWISSAGRRFNVRRRARYSMRARSRSIPVASGAVSGPSWQQRGALTQFLPVDFAGRREPR